MMSYQYPDSFVFYRKLNVKFPRVVSARGIYLFDETGKQYLDASSGAIVANIGHGIDEIAQAMAEQASKIAYVSGTMFTNSAVEELAHELAQILPGTLKYSY